MFICTLLKEHILPMTCIHLLCKLYTFHNLLQFHVSLGGLCGKVFFFLFYGYYKLNDTRCMCSVYNVFMLQVFEMRLGKERRGTVYELGNGALERLPLLFWICCC